jgi:NAD+ diphosphatase
MIAYTADYLTARSASTRAKSPRRWFGPDDAWPEPPTATSIAAELLQANRPRRYKSA